MSTALIETDFKYDKPVFEKRGIGDTDPYYIERKHWFYNWLLLPESRREPKTKVAVAEKLGVSERWLFKLQKSDEFRELKGNLYASEIEPHVAEILSASIETAKIVGKEGATDRRMILQLISPWTGLEFTQKRETKSEVTHKMDTNSFRRMSDERLIQEAAEEEVNRILDIVQEESELDEDTIKKVRERYAESLRDKMDKSDPDDADFSEFIADAKYEMVDE